MLYETYADYEPDQKYIEETNSLLTHLMDVSSYDDYFPDGPTTIDREIKQGFTPGRA